MKKTFTYGTFYPPSPTGARPYAPVHDKGKQKEMLKNASKGLIMQETTMPVPTAVTISAITLLGLTWRHET